MKLNKKLTFAVIIMFFILLIIPFIFINSSKPHEFMGIMLFLFFVVNPTFSALISLMIGKDIRKLWWMPILFCVIFILSYWMILNEVIFDLIFYAIIYLVIGVIFMFISLLIGKKRK